MSGLGPLSRRVPQVLREGRAYHVAHVPNLTAKLDANELAYGLPAELRTRLGEELAKVDLERYPDPRAAALRAAVATSLSVREDQLVFGNGSDELIALLTQAMPGPILFPTPSFVYYKLAAIARGVPTVEVPLDARFELDEAAVERAIAEHDPSVVFLALPNNPTGTLWRMEFALELAARHRDIAIVSDEAYVAYSGATNLGALAQHPNLIVMRTLSKIGMAGLRVGFTISAPAIAELLDKVRPPYNVSALDQRAAAFLVREAPEWCAARAAEIVAERGRLADGLAALPNVTVFASAANLVLVRFGPPPRASTDRGIPPPPVRTTGSHAIASSEGSPASGSLAAASGSPTAASPPSGSSAAGSPASTSPTGSAVGIDGAVTPSRARAPNLAAAAYMRLCDRGIAVRAFENAGPLSGCLRITVGTPAENDAVLDALRALA